jgi:hypothetical protein
MNWKKSRMGSSRGHIPRHGSGRRLQLNPNVVHLRRGITRKSESDVGAQRLGQVELYSILTSSPVRGGTAADGVSSRERSGLCRCRYATLGLTAEGFWTSLGDHVAVTGNFKFRRLQSSPQKGARIIQLVNNGPKLASCR